MNTLVLVLDLAGTFVFALSGAMAGVRNRLDLFGVLVLSFAAATFGGIGRDLLIGAVPPAAITDWRYVVISVVAGLVIFHWTAIAGRLRTPVLICDAAGLALFAVSGSLKALGYNAPAVAAVLLGALTGVGGGVARDILVMEIPTVLRADLYAVAALAGAAVTVTGAMLKLPLSAVSLAGAVVCFTLRFMAIRRGWHLPVAHEIGNARSPADNAVNPRRSAEVDTPNEPKP